jgi:lipid II isoglutaminyl synthase (glutamine-hydrolysing)
MHPRTIAAIIAGKAAGAASRLLGRGGGTAIAGLAALRIDPNIVRNLAAQAGAGSICVTGTNGKTTTSLMLSRIAATAGLSPLHNRSGSNLMRGVAAMLAEEASFAGAIPRASKRVAILEVDEATLPEIVRSLTPHAIVFTNLFRDQLDRYGEVDTVAKSWRQALAAGAQRAAPDGREPTIVLNADDPAVAHLGRDTRLPVLYYGLEDTTAGGEAVDHASDFRTCLQCASELTYDVTFYGHIGHWRCPSCGNARPKPDVSIDRVSLADDATTLEIATATGAMSITVPMAGLYNAYNALAAAAGAIALGLPHDAIVGALEGFSAAFGRQERFSVGGRDVQVLLAKNPAGLNQVLRTLAARDGAPALHLLFFLNDGIADGRDVSWVWDADYELLSPLATSTLAAGTRAEDMALRLKYAGYGDDIAIERQTKPALVRALRETPPGATLYVIPTYTAMLEVRALLAKMSGAASFWEGA